jgi:hypothetical protein
MISSHVIFLGSSLAMSKKLKALSLKANTSHSTKHPVRMDVKSDGADPDPVMRRAILMIFDPNAGSLIRVISLQVAGKYWNYLCSGNSPKE